MSDLNFDNHQFAGRNNYPASATTGIAFSDYARMHTQTHGAKPTAFVPPFALNDKKLQRVLLHRAWKYAHGGATLPAQFDRDALNKAATARALNGYTISNDAASIQHEAIAMHRAAIKRAGGYLEFQAAIAFRSWRLGMDSVAVAETVRITPQAVRQALWRMRNAAKQLGFEVGRAGYTAGKPRNRPGNRMSVDIARLTQLYKQGIGLWAILAKVGLTNDQKDYLYVRTRLRAAGYSVPVVIHAPTGQKHSSERPMGRPGHQLDIPKVIELYQSGLTVGNIAAVFGYQGGHGLTPVRRAIKLAGVYQPRKMRKPAGPEDCKKAVALFNSGMRLKQIALELGYQDGNSVRRILREAGVYPQKINRA